MLFEDGEKVLLEQSVLLGDFAFVCLGIAGLEQAVFALGVIHIADQCLDLRGRKGAFRGCLHFIYLSQLRSKMATALSGAQVTSSGQILLPEAPPPTEHVMNSGPGSAITAAAGKVLNATAIQNRAVTMLGGKQIGGATQVTVHPPTNMPTAGTSTVHPHDLYANLYATKAAGLAGAQYDGLHSATPQMVGGRGIVRHRKSRKHHKKHARSVKSRRGHTRRHPRRSRHVSRVHRRVSHK